MIKPRITKAKVKIPWVGELEVEVDETARNAAWELYVELHTRVAVQPLKGDAIIREALGSLHSLFPTSREILRRYGPSVGVKRGSVGAIAMGVLNKGLRPVLTHWHPRLADHEAKCPSECSRHEHESNWKHRREAIAALEELRKDLRKYSAQLLKIARK